MAGWQSSSDLARRDRIDVTIVDDHHVITGAEKPSLKCLFDTDLRSEIDLDNSKRRFVFRTVNHSPLIVPYC